MTVQRHSHSGLGGDGEKIDYRNLKNKPTSNIKFLNFERDAIVGTGLQTFSGFGFKPKSFQITAWLNGINYACMYFGGYDETGKSQGVSLIPDIGDDIETDTTSYILLVDNQDQGGGRVRASFEAFTNDGVILNFNDSGENIEFMLTCFG